MSRARKKIWIISGTHWDREWHRPFQEFRVRLVELINLVLDILTTDPAFRQFHLDGQTVVLEDYLEVRPEREELLRNLISDERLLVGPWYVLPDEFLVSGEALIRNLLLGHRIAESFGHAMSVGYLPDQFGQISQMPQILRGFGLDSVILWRGLEYERSVHNEFIWESPDGSRVLGIHLPPRGYGGLDKLADDPEGGRKKIAALLNFLAPRSASGHVLVMNGDDHAFPEPGLPAFLEGLSDEFDIRQGSLEEYIDLVRSSIDEESLSVVRGELISSKDTRVLQSVYSTRMYIKQLNHACETALERWAEPTTVYRWWLGTAPQRGLLGLSWKWLLKNHPHDSICGCSVDQVHKEMLTRFSWSKQIADMLIAENIASITEKIDTHDLLHDESEQAIIVFNPTNFPGDQVVEGECDLRSSLAMDKLAVVGNGAVVPLEVLSWEKTDPEQDVVRVRIRFLATDLPENGYASYRIMRAEGETALPRDIHAGDGWIENAHYRITLQHNGTIEILDKDCGNCYSDCLRFEDQGDRGDEYTFDPVPGAAPIYSEHVTLIASENDHLQATLKIRTEMDLPRELAPSRDERSAQTERCEIETLISLFNQAKRIDFSVSYTNTVRDHRLRVLFPCGVDTDEVHADENFDVVTRKIAVPRGEGWNEAPYPTKHVDRFLYLSDGKKVFALIPKGLPEYEVIDDKLRTVALTLIRGVGSLARRDLRNRRDSAGPVRATPEAQSLGSHTFEFAVYTSSGRYDGAELLRQASTFIAPPRIVSKMRARGDLPTRLSFFSVNLSVLEVTALKPAEESDMAVLRLFNPTEEEQCGVIWFYCPIKRAFLLNLNEEILSPISQSSEKELQITLRAKQIETIGVELTTWGGSE